MPLDALTDQRVRASLSNATRNGLNQVEMLHADGLLLTPARRHEIRLEALDELIKMLRGTNIETLLQVSRDGRAGPASPAEAYQAVLAAVAWWRKQNAETP